MQKKQISLIGLLLLLSLSSRVEAQLVVAPVSYINGSGVAQGSIYIPSPFNLNIGTISSTITDVSGNSPILLAAPAFTTSLISFAGYGNTFGGSELQGYRTRAATSTALSGLVTANDIVLRLVGLGSDGVAYKKLAAIDFIVDGTSGVNDMPGSIAFSTTPDGSTTLVHNWLIGSDGGLYVFDNNIHDIGFSLVDNSPRTIYAATSVISPVFSADSVATKIYGTEQVDPSAPAANGFVIYGKDNGSGKTQVCAKFNTGAVQCFATQP